MGAYSANTTPLDDQPSSRSFFSKFALPIRSRTSRNLADFHIRPAEPHRKYSAGDHVTGAVILTVVKPVRITHLTVALRGFVRVYKNPNVANEPLNPAEFASDGVSQFRFIGNGFASLFQDEQVLSSEGRLDAGKYEFNFDLLFPGEGLPSSIDFERGAISYMITATLTRPASIGPTTSCERRVELVEQVDVGPLAPPRPRTIYLEPISKRSRKKKTVPTTASDKASSVAADTTGESTSELDSTRAVETSTEGSAPAEESGQDAHHNPRSPVHSDIRSEVSGDSGSTGLSLRGVDPNQPGTIQAGVGKAPMADQKTITATIELMKGGCLPGDIIPIKISVQHTKPIKSMHGVIVTLYRQGRVDSAPPASLFKNISKEEARRLEKEEYYPKSKTGLGGLSLTSAGSCSVFRKDLSQSFSPLIIDPVTLTASVTTHVRVPEHVFPTIRSVPGDMISFKYRLEVIVDLGGRLANAIQVGQNMRVAQTGGMGGLGREAPAGMASFDGSLVNTDTLKREKGVIFDSFEVIVGTSDSSRRSKGRQPASVHATHTQDGTPHDENAPWGENWEEDAYGQEEYHQVYEPYPPEPMAPHLYWNGGAHEPSQPSAPVYIPPPDMPDERGLSEKERIRRAEQRLLPSQPGPPPHMPGPPSTPGENIYDADSAGPSAPSASFAASPPGDSPSNEAGEDAPSAPTLEELTSNPSANAADDKQELERQRLLAEASAPPEFPDDYDAGVGSSSSAEPSARNSHQQQNFEPSAPVLTEEDEYGQQYTYNNLAGAASSHAPSAPQEPLPRYER